MCLREVLCSLAEGQLEGTANERLAIKGIEKPAPKNEERLETLLGEGTEGGIVGGMFSFRHGALLIAPSVTYQGNPSFNEISQQALALRLGAGVTLTPTRHLRLDGLLV